MKNSEKKSGAPKKGAKKLEAATLKNVKGGFSKLLDRSKGVSTKPIN